MIKKCTLGLITALFLLSSCASSKRTEKIVQLNLQIGTSLLAEGRAREALRYFREALEQDPKNADVHNNMGLAYFVLNETDLAKNAFEEAIDLDSDFPQAHNNYSRLLIELEKYPEAIKQANRALEFIEYTDREKAFLNRGIAYFKSGDLASAEDSLMEALKIKRDDCLAQNYVGRVYFERGNYKKAAQLLDKAVKVCLPLEFDEPHYFAGLSYFRMGDHDAALIRFQQVRTAYHEGRYRELATQATRGLQNEKNR